MLNISYYDGVKYHRMDFINRDKDFYGNGVVQLTQFPFNLPTPNNMTIQIGAGVAWVDGYRIENDSTAITLTVSAADATNPRIDIVQIGHDDINSQAVLTIKKGVAASTPIEPDADPNYVKLFAINVPANATSIVTGNITDRRGLVPLNVSATQISMGGAAGTGQKNTFSDTQTFSKGVAPINIPNQTVLPAVGPVDTLCIVNSNWYRSDGANWVPMAPPPNNASLTVSGVTKLNSSTTSTDETTAATPKAVKSAMDQANTANSAAGTAQSTANAKYTKPGTGIPKTDLETAVQTSLGKADTAVQSVASASTSQAGVVQLIDSVTSTSITTAATPNSVKSANDNANTRYTKPAGGIPSTDLASSVQTSLNSANSAYQKPAGGIPSTDLSTSVQSSLNLANTALQAAPVTSVNNKTGSVSLSASDVGAASTTDFTAHTADYVSHITATERITWNGKETPSGSLSKVEQNSYETVKSNKDINGIYVTVQHKRKLDGTLVRQSVLSGGTSPQYTTRTVTYYTSDGTTVIKTETYTLTYDSDGDLLSEV
jgi:hypothetical protein